MVIALLNSLKLFSINEGYIFNKTKSVNLTLFIFGKFLVFLKASISFLPCRPCFESFIKIIFQSSGKKTLLILVKNLFFIFKSIKKPPYLKLINPTLDL